MISLVSQDQVQADSGKACTSLTKKEFDNFCLYHGMPEAEFQVLLDSPASPSPLRVLRHKTNRYTTYTLGWNSRWASFEVYFYQGRLVNAVYRGWKGWLPEWRTSSVPFAKMARLRIHSVPNEQVLFERLERILVQLGHVPRPSPWKWENLGYVECYIKAFDEEATPPQPVLDILVLPDKTKTGVFELRVAPGDYPWQVDKTGYMAPVHALPVTQINDVPFEILDVNFVDTYATRFSAAVDAFVEALRRELGQAHVEHLQ